MKPPFSQTAFERMTDEEVMDLRKFCGDESKGAQARLWVIFEALRREALKRGLIEDDRVRLELGEVIQRQRIEDGGQAAIASFQKAAMHRYDDPDFRLTVRAAYGTNDFFGDRAVKAARECDENFFKTVCAALEAVSAHQAGRTIGGRSRMLEHVHAAISYFHQLEENEKWDGKVTKKELKEELQKWLPDTCFSEGSESWPEFFRRREIAPFVEQAQGGGRPSTSGHGRGVEDYHVDGPEIARG